MKNGKFVVKEIKRDHVLEWITNKHYAKRKCSISFSFGLFESGIMVGVCTFGYPPNYNFNNGKCVFKKLKVLTLELNRLITNDNLGKNALSYFVSQCLKQLPKPSCVVSYADPNAGHYGYIYQATNWIFTGDSTTKLKYVFEDGETFDIRRGLDSKIKEHGKIIDTIKLLPTQRYLYFNGSKTEKKRMFKDLKMKTFEYPKGENTNYDTSYACKTLHISDINVGEQLSLF